MKKKLNSSQTVCIFLSIGQKNIVFPLVPYIYACYSLVEGSLLNNKDLNKKQIVFKNKLTWTYQP